MSSNNNNAALPIIEEAPETGEIEETPCSVVEENLSMKAMLTAIRSELRDVRSELAANRREMSLIQGRLVSRNQNLSNSLSQVSGHTLMNQQSGDQLHTRNIGREVPAVSETVASSHAVQSSELNSGIPSASHFRNLQITSANSQPQPLSSSCSTDRFPSQTQSQPIVLQNRASSSSSFASSIAYLNQFQSAMNCSRPSADVTIHNELPREIPNLNINNSNWLRPDASNANLSFGGTRKKLHPLPQFNGNPEEWPIFEASFHESNVAFQYTDVDNNFRLIEALKGRAKEAVEGLLLFPRNVNEVIRKLKFEFGRPELIVRSQLEKIRKIPSLDENNLDQHILQFSNKIANMVTFLQSCGSEQHLCNPILLEELILKLPYSKRYEWIQYAHLLQRAVTVEDFSRWLTGVAELNAMLPVDMRKTLKAKVMTTIDNHQCADNSEESHMMVTHIESNKFRNRQRCSFCEQEHRLIDCEKFKKLGTPERWDHVKRSKLCFCCLFRGHGIFNCRKKKKCGIDTCTKFHNMLLHNKSLLSNESLAINLFENKDNILEQESKIKDSSVMRCNLFNTSVRILVKVIPIFIHGPLGRKKIFAFVDEGSQISMLNSHVAKQIGLNGAPLTLHLNWLNNFTIKEQSHVCDVNISGINTCKEHLPLKNVKIVENMSLPSQSIDIESLCSKYKYLKGLPITNQENVVPDLLIGLDNLDVFKAEEYIHGTKYEPSVVKTPLGWMLYGPSTCNLEKGDEHCFCVFKTHMLSLSDVHELISDYFSHDNLGIEPKNEILETKDDIRAKNIMFKTSKRIGNRFETGLLWKRDNVCLPNSFNMAKSRLIIIERKMAVDREYAEGYKRAVQAFVDKGYARKLSCVEAQKESNRTWYLPHFGVVNVNKPGKVRVVFDGAARVDGISLNDELLKGPDQYQPLLAVLFRFREGKVGVCADIAEMFPQILIRQEDRDSQRFLWREGDFNHPVDIYEMVAMTFGAKCSPSSAQFVKNLNAMEFLSEHSEAVREIVESHYVDDYVSSFETEEAALSISQTVKNIHSRGGFNLRGFVSNSLVVSTHLNGESGKELDMNVGELKTEKILGMFWETGTDSFTFKFKYNKIHPDVLNGKRLPTKRELLALVMSVFDPFGLVANFLIKAKLLLQEVWKSSIKWDETVSDSVAKRWHAVQNLLYKLESFKIPRCYSSDCDITDIELHCFVDSSESAMAAVCYFKFECLNGKKIISFVCAKTKCCPIKYMSIPRCELQAAVMGSRLKKSVIEFHRFNISKTFLWSDSRTVLFWINGETRRYQQFVANRLSEILDNSDKSEWLWVPTKQNPADEGTRERSLADKNSEHNIWLNGPQWLRNNNDWPEQPIFTETTSSTKELRKTAIDNIFIITTVDTIIDYDKFSSYIKLLRSVAYIFRFRNNLLSKIKQGDGTSGPLNTREIHFAEKWICSEVQKESFKDDYFCIADGKQISRNSKLRKHLPYLDEDKLLRVFGRIDNSNILPIYSKRPIILPKEHRLSRLIIKHYHSKYLHQNEDVIICEIRRKFWIDGLRGLVRKHGKDCIKCQIERRQTYQPILGQLPRDRLTPFVRPFSYCGLDYFGPIIISVGRRTEKRWVALFTCLTVRAVHIEISPDLSADSCILCIRNFMNFRGTPIRIRTDNGTNLVGAKNELIKAKDFYGNISIRDMMSIEGIEWMCNTPLHPSEGGCWERMIRSVKRVLKFSLKEKHPREATLRSFLYEAMNILNSRPLTHVPVESIHCEPLTPNHFLLGCPNSIQTFLPEGYKVNLGKQWRVAQQMLTTFWKRWISEFLPTLTRRAKGFENLAERPIKENDLVVICDGKAERNIWERGLVVELITDRYGVARKARVKTQTSILERPVSKLAVIDLNRCNT